MDSLTIGGHTLAPGTTDNPIRILALSPFFPYPPHDGFSLRVWNVYNHLAKKTHLTLVCCVENIPPPESLGRCTAENINLEILQIPHQSRLSEYSRKLLTLLKHYPVWTAGYSFPEMNRFLQHLLDGKRFDLIVIESTWLAYCWPALVEQHVPKILNLGDLDSEKWHRQAALLPMGRKKLHYTYNAFGFKRLEDHMLRRVDLTFVPSERERMEVRERHEGIAVEVLPNGVDSVAIRPLPFSESRQLLFVGSLSYLPNVEGILYFATRVLPELRRRFPDLSLLIVGRTPSDAVKSLQGINGVEVVGEVPDLEPYYRRSALCVVPLRAGSGTRLKVLEAMAYGRPVVSTGLGCEGLDVEHRRNLLIADQPDEIADAVTELLVSAEFRNSLVQEGRSLVETKYSWTTIVDRMYQQCLQLTKSRSPDERECFDSRMRRSHPRDLQKPSAKT
jgi:polysaccharide biosynthesis protein PslH